MSQPPEPNGDGDPSAAFPPVPPPAAPFTPPPASPFASPVPPPPPQAPPLSDYGQGFAPTAVPPGMYFDQASGLTLPVGVELASSGRRIGAWFLSIPLSIGTLFIGYLVWGLIVWGRGQTPALQVLGMRCWRPETGKVASWGWMALREIVGRIVESILSIITLLLSLILMVSGKRRQSLHDLIAGTVVLRDPNKILAGR